MAFPICVACRQSHGGSEQPGRGGQDEPEDLRPLAGDRGGADEADHDEAGARPPDRGALLDVRRRAWKASNVTLLITSS